MSKRIEILLGFDKSICRVSQAWVLVGTESVEGNPGTVPSLSLVWVDSWAIRCTSSSTEREPRCFSHSESLLVCNLNMILLLLNVHQVWLCYCFPIKFFAHNYALYFTAFDSHCSLTVPRLLGGERHCGGVQGYPESLRPPVLYPSSHYGDIRPAPGGRHRLVLLSMNSYHWSDTYPGSSPDVLYLWQEHHFCLNKQLILKKSMA